MGRPRRKCAAPTTSWSTWTWRLTTVCTSWPGPSWTTDTPPEWSWTSSCTASWLWWELNHSVGVRIILPSRPHSNVCVCVCCQVEKTQTFIPFIWATLVSETFSVWSYKVQNIKSVGCFSSEMERRTHLVGPQSVLWNHQNFSSPRPDLETRPLHLRDVRRGGGINKQLARLAYTHTLRLVCWNEV